LPRYAFGHKDDEMINVLFANGFSMAAMGTGCGE